MRKVFRAVLLSAALATIVSTPAHAAGSAAGIVRVAIDGAVADSNFDSVGRDRVVILQSWRTALASSIKAAHPGVKVLMYRNLSSMATRDQWGNLATGVSTQDAAAHPEWYLLNTSGQRFTFSGFDWLWAADVGNADFQQTWADNVLGDLKRGPWDGVFMDDTNPTMSGHYTASAVAKYPSDRQYQAATRSALVAISARLHAAGELLVPNVGALHSYASVLPDWLPYVDGVMEEHFTKWETPAGTGYMTGAEWKVALDEVKTVEATGKMFLGVARSDAGDAAAARYGYATMLLAANGHSSFAMHNNYTTENWFPDFDRDIGSPMEAERTLASGAHARSFTGGIVLVNPTTSSLTVALDGAYSGSGVEGVHAVTMAPASGLILNRDTVAISTPIAMSTDPAPPAPSIARASDVPAVASDPAPAERSAPIPTAAAPPATAIAAVTAPAAARHNVRLTCHGAASCTVKVTLRSGRRVLSSQRTRVAAASSRTITFRLAATRTAAQRASRRVAVVVTAVRGGRAVASPRTLLVA